MRFPGCFRLGSHDTLIPSRFLPIPFHWQVLQKLSNGLEFAPHEKLAPLNDLIMDNDPKIVSLFSHLADVSPHARATAPLAVPGTRSEAAFAWLYDLYTENAQRVLDVLAADAGDEAGAVRERIERLMGTIALLAKKRGGKDLCLFTLCCVCVFVVCTHPGSFRLNFVV